MDADDAFSERWQWLKKICGDLANFSITMTKGSKAPIQPWQHAHHWGPLPADKLLTMTPVRHAHRGKKPKKTTCPMTASSLTTMYARQTNLLFQLTVCVLCLLSPTGTSGGTQEPWIAIAFCMEWHPFHHIWSSTSSTLSSSEEVDCMLLLSLHGWTLPSFPRHLQLWHWIKYPQGHVYTFPMTPGSKLNGFTHEVSSWTGCFCYCATVNSTWQKHGLQPEGKARMRTVRASYYVYGYIPGYYELMRAECTGCFSSTSVLQGYKIMH